LTDSQRVDTADTLARYSRPMTDPHGTPTTPPLLRSTHLTQSQQQRLLKLNLIRSVRPAAVDFHDVDSLKDIAFYRAMH